MIYASETIKYLKKSFWLLALICLPLAVIFSLFSSPVSFLSFLPSYATQTITDFDSVLWLILQKETITRIYPIFIMVVVLFLTLCMCFAVIERHMRTGKLLAKNPLHEINHYFIPTLKTLFVLLALAVLYLGVLVSISTLQHFAVSGEGESNVISLIVVIILALALFTLFVFLIAPLLFMSPLMQIYGYTFGDALSKSVSLYSANTFKIAFGLLLVYVCCAVIQTIISMLSFIFVLEFIIKIVLNVILFTYTASYCMIVTFSSLGMERRDKKNLYWKEGN